MPHAQSPSQRRFTFTAQSCLVGVFLFFPIKLGAANTLLALTILFWLLGGGFQGRWQQVASNPITKPALIMFSLVFVGAFYSLAPTDAILNALNKYSKFLMIPVCLSLLMDASWRQRCWHAFTVAMIVTLASTYAGLWVHVPWAVAPTPNAWGSDHTVFKDYIAQGLLMSTFVVLALSKSATATKGIIKLGWVALAVAAAVSVLFLSNGRTGYLAIAAALVVYTGVISTRRWRLVVMGLTALVLAVLLSLSSTAQQRIHTIFTEVQTQLTTSEGLKQLDGATSIGARLTMWSFSVEQIKARPLFGAGTGAYGTLAREACGQAPPCDVVSVHPHNQFLFFGVELGSLGLLAYVLYLSSAARGAGQLPRPQRALLLSFLAIMVVDSLVHGALWLAVENHLFTFVLALLMAEVGARHCAVKQTA
jgi:O-antigen ligase